MARSFWSDTAQADRRLEEALTAEALAGPSRPAHRSLLQAALLDGTAAWSGQADHPFFRLDVRTRFLLLVFCRGGRRFSYAETALMLETEVRDLESLLWQARIEFAATAGQSSWPRPSKEVGPSCPEYDSDRPWTQRFLDNELGGRERVFLQTHLTACDGCRRTLESTRQLVFDIEGKMREWVQISPVDRADIMHQWLPSTVSPGRAGWLSFRNFVVRNRDAQLSIGVGIILLAIWAGKQFF